MSNLSLFEPLLDASLQKGFLPIFTHFIPLNVSSNPPKFLPEFHIHVHALVHAFAPSVHCFLLTPTLFSTFPLPLTPIPAQSGTSTVPPAAVLFPVWRNLCRCQPKPCENWSTLTAWLSLLMCLSSCLSQRKRFGNC